jgi:hypothetical protein
MSAGISEMLYYGWRHRLLEAGRERFAGKEERQGEQELRRKVAELERALGRKTYELEIAGKLLREWGRACASPVPTSRSRPGIRSRRVGRIRRGRSWFAEHRANVHGESSLPLARPPKMSFVSGRRRPREASSEAEAAELRAGDLSGEQRAP